jgi:polyisoprenoid-binding protein YceI
VRVEAEGESPLQLSGILKLRGEEHELMLATTVTRSGGQLTASTHFMIPYVDWGLKNPGGLLLRVGNQVQIDLRTVCRITLPASISR